MKLCVTVIVACLVVILAGCATPGPAAPETAEEGWSRATSRNTLWGYKSFVNRHPDSPYDAQARQKLSEAQAARAQVLASNAQKAEQMRAAGRRVWVCTNDAGEQIVLYQSMTTDQTEQALGFPLLLSEGFETFAVNYGCPVTGIRLVFAHGGLLTDVGQGATRFNERDMQTLGIDSSNFPRSLSVQQQ